MAKFWEKYRVPVIGAATALILAVAGYQVWSYMHAQEVEKSSREMEAIGLLLRDPGSAKQATERLGKLAETGTGAYATLAKLQQAALVAQAGDIKTAIKLYEAAANAESSPLFRDFAIVRAGVFLVEVESYENAKKVIAPVASGDGPWALQAKELLAYAAWRSGKADEARVTYEAIEKNADAPVGVKRRSIEMLALIRSGLKFADVKPAAPLLLPPTNGPMLLQPTPPAEQPNSLLGPDPVLPAPATPSDPSSTPQ